MIMRKKLCGLILSILTFSTILSQSIMAESISDYTLKEKLKSVTDKEIHGEAYGDYNGDGIIECFFQTRNVEDDYYSNSIWYVTPDQIICVYDWKAVFLGTSQLIDGILIQTIEGKKWNEFWTIQDNIPVLINIPDDIIVDSLYQDPETGVIYGIEINWAESGERIFIHHLLKLDIETLSFIDLHKTFVTYSLL